MTQTVQPPAAALTEAAMAEAAMADGLAVAAGAAATLLPATGTLTPGTAIPSAEVAPGDWAAAAVVPLERSGGAALGILMRADLVEALAAAPEGALDLADAVQPALDAAAEHLGLTAGPGRTILGAELAAAVGSATATVPLLAGKETAMVLFALAGDGTPASPKTAAARAKAAPQAETDQTRGVELLHGVAMEVTVELGRTRLSVRELLALSPGDVLELDRAAGSPADLLVNGRLIARGEVVVVDEDFALRVTEIVANSAGG